ncbi:MAG TPA: hypothetical protein VH969_25145 [Actinophytocola sp.]|uniref:hypothetical protein n=1 Tax=Actinophytocola sp. TaxID=1872138 RepID=UPI002F9238A5
MIRRRKANVYADPLAATGAPGTVSGTLLPRAPWPQGPRPLAGRHRPGPLVDPRRQVRGREPRRHDGARGSGVPIPVAVGRRLRAQGCGLGASVRRQVIPLAEHILGVSMSGPAAMTWLGDRFAGRPAAGNC